MSRWSNAAALFVALLVVIGVPTGAEAQAAGLWVITVNGPQGQSEITADLVQEGGSVTGTLTAAEIGSAPLTEGTLEGNTLKFLIVVDVNGQGFEIQGEGEIDGDSIAGSLYVAEAGTMPFTGRRTER